MSENGQPTPNRYEKAARKEIVAFRNQKQRLASKVLETALTPVSKGTEIVMDHTPAGKATEGILSLVGDFTATSVKDSVAVKRLAKSGVTIDSVEDIRGLRLKQLDDAVDGLHAKYVTMMGSEGAVAGAAGVFGPWAAAGAIATDLAATTAMGLRLVDLYAACYGYPVSNQTEKQYALGVMHAAALPGGQEKRAALAELSLVARMASQKKAWEQLNKKASTRAIKEVAEKLGVRLTKAKLAAFVPVAGAVVGGSFNSNYAHKVSTTAFQSYRARFLEDKYGDDFLRE